MAQLGLKKNKQVTKLNENISKITKEEIGDKEIRYSVPVLLVLSKISIILTCQTNGF